MGRLLGWEHASTLQSGVEAPRCLNGTSPDCIIVNVVVVVVVSDACSTVCLSTAVMPMQQSLRLIGGGSPRSRDFRV